MNQLDAFSEFLNLLPPEAILLALCNEAGELYCVFDRWCSTTTAAEELTERCNRYMPQGDDLFADYSKFFSVPVAEIRDNLEDWKNAIVYDLGSLGSAMSSCGVPPSALRALEA